MKKENVSHTNLIDGENIARKKKSGVVRFARLYARWIVHDSIPMLIFTLPLSLKFLKFQSSKSKIQNYFQDRKNYFCKIIFCVIIFIIF